MIQRIAPPPSASKPITPVASPPVNRPMNTQVRNQVAQPAATVTPTAVRQNTTQQASLSRYEQTQRFLKDQILAVQLKSKDLKENERKMMMQSFGALGGSIGLVLAFIFIIFPLLIRFAGNLGSLTVFTQADTIPPRVPSLSAPVEATQDTSIELTGFAEPKSVVVLVKNGSEQTRKDIDDSGSFSIMMDLDEGENKVALYSIDEAKNESTLSKEYIIVSDHTPPEVDWQSPEDQNTIRNLRDQSIEVKGKVNESAKVVLNDQFVSVSSDGNFNTDFLLSDGENKLTLKVTDKAKNETVVERTIFFKP